MIKVLRAAGIEPTILDASVPGPAQDKVKELGYSSVPVTTYQDLVLKGYDPRDLAGLIERVRQHGH